MKRWALIQDAKVATVVEQDQPPTSGGQWLECTNQPVGPGFGWDGRAWALAAPTPDVRRVSIGAFKDRLGMDAHAIAVSAHPACVAAREAIVGRKWVDLGGPTTSWLFDLLIFVSQPVANPMFPGSGPMTLAKKTAILSAPVLESELP